MVHPVNPLTALCPYCDTEITVHQKIRPGHCANPICLHKHAVEGDKIRETAGLERYQSQATAAKGKLRGDIDAQAAAHGVDPALVYVAPVPHSNVPLIRLPDDRRGAYLAHLAKITTEAFEHPLPATGNFDRDHTSERSEPHPWNNIACGACRGNCCQTQGGGSTHAFQTVKSITQLRQAQPNLTADDVIDLYTTALPEVSNDGGCVFQGPQGCVLERSHRADVCNTFRCYALRRLAQDVDLESTDAVALVSMDEMTPHRLAIYVKDAC